MIHQAPLVHGKHADVPRGLFRSRRLRVGKGELLIGARRQNAACGQQSFRRFKFVEVVAGKAVVVANHKRWTICGIVGRVLEKSLADGIASHVGFNQGFNVKLEKSALTVALLSVINATSIYEIDGDRCRCRTDLRQRTVVIPINCFTIYEIQITVDNKGVIPIIF